MTGKTHLLGGALAAEIICAAARTAPASAEGAVIIAAAAAGALLPDIDHPNATISRKSVFTRVVSGGIGLVTVHRGFTHTVLFSLAVSLLPLLLYGRFGRICVYAAAGLFLGMLSHLLLDTFNPTGIMWAYPVSKRHFRLGKVVTGSMQEMLFTLIALGAVIAVWILFERSGLYG